MTRTPTPPAEVDVAEGRRLTKIDAPLQHDWPIAIWPLRLPIIRHIRAMAFSYRCNRHYAFYHSIGMLGGWSDAEIEYWTAIKRGKA